ncbi:MAG: DUF2804 domain-containing protein, partial [Microcella sp.]|nr:DUF2804 domain-containing protein [Microcella sp.]
MTLREITEPIDLCVPNGRLNPEAIGRTRTPLHRTPLRGWGRTKRWEYWGIMTPDWFVGLTVSSLDYAAVPSIYLVNRATGEHRTLGGLVPLARGTSIPDTLPPFEASTRWGGGELRMHSEVAATSIRGTAKDFAIDVTSPDSGDALGVVVPWSDRLFQYTLKDVARPVSGTITVDGRSYDVGEGSWAVLDRGRGRWPYRMTWNWAAGSGIVDGRRIGLQLGGKWTDGTGSTENAVFVDGVQHYIAEEFAWHYDLDDAAAPWRIVGEHADVTLTPWHLRVERTNALVVASTIHQALGTW